MDTGADIRAERLRVTLALLNGYPYIEPRECAPPLSAAEVILVEDIDERDTELLNACLEVERELRECGYAAISRLSAEVAGRGGKLNDRIKSLPPSEVRRALRDMDEAGWLSLPPTEV